MCFAKKGLNWPPPINVIILFPVRSYKPLSPLYNYIQNLKKEEEKNKFILYLKSGLTE